MEEINEEFEIKFESDDLGLIPKTYEEIKNIIKEYVCRKRILLDLSIPENRERFKNYTRECIENYPIIKSQFEAVMYYNFAADIVNEIDLSCFNIYSGELPLVITDDFKHLKKLDFEEVASEDCCMINDIVINYMDITMEYSKIKDKWDDACRKANEAIKDYESKISLLSEKTAQIFVDRKNEIISRKEQLEDLTYYILCIDSDEPYETYDDFTNEYREMLLDEFYKEIISSLSSKIDYSKLHEKIDELENIHNASHISEANTPKR